MATTMMVIITNVAPVFVFTFRLNARSYEHHLGNNALMQEGEIMDTLLRQLSTDVD